MCEFCSRYSACGLPPKNGFLQAFLVYDRFPLARLAQTLTSFISDRSPPLIPTVEPCEEILEPKAGYHWTLAAQEEPARDVTPAKHVFGIVLRPERARAAAAPPARRRAGINCHRRDVTRCRRTQAAHALHRRARRVTKRPGRRRARNRLRAHQRHEPLYVLFGAGKFGGERLFTGRVHGVVLARLRPPGALKTKKYPFRTLFR